jgi:anthranilate synthase component 1
MREGIVTVRPIAGTEVRGANKAEDEKLAQQLLANPKELAEHLMLLDLGRNDVGRVSEVGSVTVTDQMVVEYYSHVMHIVSNVIGTLRHDRDAMDALMAGFPAGTVSGAPKIRAMEIIDELEPSRRGIYAGCIGYISGNGDMDTCIALRTAVLKDEKMYVQAGAGIVADSDPEKEFQETRNKARALIKAAEIAPRYAQSQPLQNSVFDLNQR